jgi:hypothetical protein
VTFFSYLSLLTTLLVAVAGVIMPLGLSAGADLHTPLKTAPASFVEDTSPMGLATSPRSNYVYGRVCGSLGPVPCPGNAVNTTVIPADIVSRFNATPYGSFGMQVCFQTISFHSFRTLAYSVCSSDGTTMAQQVGGPVFALNKMLTI